MDAFIAANEPTIRLVMAGGLFALLALSEWARPRRRLELSKGRRWATNLAIVALDSVIVRLLFPAALVGVAVWAQARGFGLFHAIDAPFWLAAAASIVLLDLAVWASHLASHKVPIFWRVHRMHHADRDFDVTTALRFHPVEIVASMVWKGLVVVVLGAPAVAVILFEILLNGASIFNHANWRIPPALDRWLRLVVVTPDMHRVHHSVEHRETDSNYGFALPWWDRLFGTYVDQPGRGHDGMEIGLETWRDERPARLGWSLALPFRSRA